MAWNSENEKRKAVQRLKEMKTDSPPVFFTGQKTTTKDFHAGTQCRQLKFSPCLDPVSGSESFLLAETDVTQLMAARLKAEELEESNELKDRFLQVRLHAHAMHAHTLFRHQTMRLTHTRAHSDALSQSWATKRASTHAVRESAVPAIDSLPYASAVPDMV